MTVHVYAAAQLTQSVHINLEAIHAFLQSQAFTGKRFDDLRIRVLQRPLRNFHTLESLEPDGASSIGKDHEYDEIDLFIWHERDEPGATNRSLLRCLFLLTRETDQYYGGPITRLGVEREAEAFAIAHDQDYPCITFGPAHLSHTNVRPLQRKSYARYNEEKPGQGPRPTIVCLCGSTRFLHAFQQANLEETLAGRVVLSVGCDTKDDAMLGLATEVKAQLDQLHTEKIRLADEVLVLNVDNYAGSSTRNEILLAAALGKSIRWLVPPSDELRALTEQGALTHPPITSANVGDQVQISDDALVPQEYECYLSQPATVVKTSDDGGMLEVEVADGTHVFLYPGEVSFLPHDLDEVSTGLDRRSHL